MRLTPLSFVLLACVGAAAGCGASNQPAGALEIGVRGPDDAFRPLSDGDTFWVGDDGTGEYRLTASFRAWGIDPRAPDANVEVWIGGSFMAGETDRGAIDMFPDGGAYVLWDVPVEFGVRGCCFVCREAVIDARLEDSSGRRYERDLIVRLARERGGCPDTETCCASADECPDPALTQVCP